MILKLYLPLISLSLWATSTRAYHATNYLITFDDITKLNNPYNEFQFQQVDNRGLSGPFANADILRPATGPRLDSIVSAPGVLATYKGLLQISPSSSKCVFDLNSLWFYPAFNTESEGQRIQSQWQGLGILTNAAQHTVWFDNRKEEDKKAIFMNTGFADLLSDGWKDLTKLRVSSFAINEGAETGGLVDVIIDNLNVTLKCQGGDGKTTLTVGPGSTLTSASPVGASTAGGTSSAGTSVSTLAPTISGSQGIIPGNTSIPTVPSSPPLVGGDAAKVAPALSLGFVALAVWVLA